MKGSYEFHQFLQLVSSSSSSESFQLLLSRRSDQPPGWEQVAVSRHLKNMHISLDNVMAIVGVIITSLTSLTGVFICVHKKHRRQAPNIGVGDEETNDQPQEPASMVSVSWPLSTSSQTPSDHDFVALSSRPSTPQINTSSPKTSMVPTEPYTAQTSQNISAADQNVKCNDSC